MTNKLTKNIGLVLFCVFFFIMKYSNTLRNSIFYILLILVLGLLYKYKTQKDNLGEWYINKLALFVFLCIFIMPAIGYTLIATGNFMIVLIAILIAGVIAFLVSLEKEKEGDFKVSITMIKSISKDELIEILYALEKSEQALIIQRFGIDNGKPMSINTLTGIYNMDYKELKDWLTLVDEKLFESIKLKTGQSRGRFC